VPLPISTRSGEGKEWPLPGTRKADATHNSHVVSASQPFCLPPSPSADLLLNLIQYNVLRGVFANKSALVDLVAYFAIEKSPAQRRLPFAKDVYPVRAIIQPTTSGLPASLLPTRLQMTTEHQTWIDSIPFPNMRDNLIKREAEYDPSDFAWDIIGDLLDITIHFAPRTVDQAETTCTEGTSLPDDDGLTTARKGLIVWGDPQDPGNWEATPGFIQKWRWTMDGCEHLIRSSNHWRQVRGEEPLRLSF
jgi:hypothetical protein